MSGDGLIWLVILVSLLLLNTMAIHFKESNKLNFIWSGIIIIVVAPLIAFTAGAIFLQIDKSSEGGEGAGFGAAFIGLIIAGNGIIYVLIGLGSLIAELFRKKS
ncbi:ABC transporter permease [Peribacillus sp. SCS-155]|uniref:ABC transporter permease n=1 Tax=Peribacillus sedimenti TaxID=3115297 RepID=UPI00390646DE